MAEQPEQPEQPDAGTCGERAHIWSWDSTVQPTCPLTQPCLCGGTTWGAALQAPWVGERGKDEG